MNASYSDMYRALMEGSLKGDEQKLAAKSTLKQLTQKLKESGYADDIPDVDDSSDDDDTISSFVGAVTGNPHVAAKSCTQDQRDAATCQPEISEPVFRDRHPYVGYLLGTLAKIVRCIRRGNRKRNGG